jgi:hypothetical protein
MSLQLLQTMPFFASHGLKEVLGWIIPAIPIPSTQPFPSLHQFQSNTARAQMRN